MFGWIWIAVLGCAEKEGSGIDKDNDGVYVEDDCDDYNAAIGEPVIGYSDEDGDGFGDPDNTIEECDLPSGYVEQGTDCNDQDANSNPDAVEECDEVDNNCDGFIDEDLVQEFYLDNDEDGYGVGDPTSGCEAPDGYAAESGDCNDDDNSINPGAEEVCNAIDDNCNDRIDDDDETLVVAPQYEDADADGYGTGAAVKTCDVMEGYVTADGDCDDDNDSVNPGVMEIYGDEIDNDCSGEADTDCGSQGGSISVTQPLPYLCIEPNQSKSVAKFTGVGGICTFNCTYSSLSSAPYFTLSSQEDCSDELPRPYSVEFSPTGELHLCLHGKPEFTEDFSVSGCYASLESGSVDLSSLDVRADCGN
ncbi:MAG: MopE-related protein [Myxococcota bacterium]|nr:MopE-related protein [Myxococcota bacterium]